MKKALLIVWSALSVLAVGCLDIEEEITLNADGSGNYEMRMDLNGAMDLIMSMAPDSITADMDPDTFLDSLLRAQGGMEQMEASIEKLNSRDGISNAQQNLKGGVLSIAYNFRSVEALNQAASDEDATMENPFGLSPPQYSGKKGRFSRTMDAEDVEMDEEMEQMMGMMEMMMADATYSTIYNFPGKVKKVSNKAAAWSNGNRTLTVKVNLLELLEDPELMNASIKYKRK